MCAITDSVVAAARRIKDEYGWLDALVKQCGDYV